MSGLSWIEVRAVNAFLAHDYTASAACWREALDTPGLRWWQREEYAGLLGEALCEEQRRRNGKEGGT